MNTPSPDISRHILVLRLWPLRDDLADVRRAAALAAYMEATGVPLSKPATPEELERVRDWLHAEEANMPVDADGYSAAVLYGPKHLVAKPLVSPDLGTKLGWLQQAPCVTCARAPLTPLGIGFSIRVRPFAAESLDTPSWPR